MEAILAVVLVLALGASLVALPRLLRASTPTPAPMEGPSVDPAYSIPLTSPPTPVVASLPPGPAKCKAGGCEDAATHFQPTILRDEGTVDLFRRRFGGQDRLRIGTNEPTWTQKLQHAIASHPLPIAEPAFCSEHIHLAVEEVRAELTDIEHGRVKAYRDDQARLAYFTKIGLFARISKRMSDAGEKRRPRSPGKLVSIRAAQTGSDK